jgi:hypothetical protein
MKNVFFAIIILSLYGCTYTAKPYQMKPEMVSDFHSNGSVNLVNVQTEGLIRIDNSGAGGMKVNLKDATDSAITLFRQELEKKGITSSDSSKKTISLSLERLYMGNYFVAIGCTATLSVKTASGISKTFVEQNTSGIGLPQACNFALTKVVASALNDNEIRSFIDPSLNSENTAGKKLSDLKVLFMDGLITEDEFNAKKSEILGSI